MNSTWLPLTDSPFIFQIPPPPWNMHHLKLTDLFPFSPSQTATKMTTEVVEAQKEEQKSSKPEVENAGSNTDSDSDDESAPELEEAPDAAAAAAQSEVRNEGSEMALKGEV